MTGIESEAAITLPTNGKRIDSPRRRGWLARPVHWLDRQAPSSIWVIALGLIVIFAGLDYLLRRSLDLSMLFVIPVSLVAYYVGPRQGYLVSVLAAAARTMTGLLRQTDLVARLGGDEFALLLPETDAPGARIASRKVHQGLGEAMQRRGWEVTGSMGALNRITHDVVAARLVSLEAAEPATEV